MKNLTSFLLAPVLCLAVSTIGQEAPPAKQDPASKNEGISAAEVLDKYLATTGGIEVRRALQSMESYGRFGLEGFHERFRSGGIGDFHFYFKAPANDAFELEHAQHGFHGYTWIGHNNGERFFRHTVKSNWAINGVTVESMEEAWLALMEWDFSHHYSQIKLVGRSDVNGKPAYALLFTPPEGDSDVRYFDATSFLLVRMDQVGRYRTKVDGPESKRKIESYYSDYQDTSGIKFPRLIVAIGNPSVPKSRAEFVVGNVKVNSTFDDSVFKKE